MTGIVSDQLHGFRIPHEHAICIADTIVVRIPRPPQKVGSIWTPQQSQDIIQHNIVAGKIIKMGPLAFTYRDIDGDTKRADIRIGDWVTFRPHAGSMIQPNGQVGAVGGMRYLSAFRDVLAIFPLGVMGEAERMLGLEDAAS